MTVPSVRHPHLLIVYIMCETNPGMVYWDHIPNPDFQPELNFEFDPSTETLAELLARLAAAGATASLLDRLLDNLRHPQQRQHGYTVQDLERYEYITNVILPAVGHTNDSNWIRDAINGWRVVFNYIFSQSCDE